MKNASVVSLLLVVVMLSVGQGAGRAQASATLPETANRPTSAPYTGDLSIFETPGREDRLQIDRVMDLLGLPRVKEWWTLERDRDGLQCGLPGE